MTMVPYRWLCSCGAGATRSRVGQPLTEKAAFAAAQAHVQVASANQDHVWDLERHFGRTWREQCPRTEQGQKGGAQ